MKAKRFFNIMMASLVGVAFCSCSSDDDVLTSGQGTAVPTPAVKTYKVSVEAQKNGTRALALDGTSITSTWTKDDVVKVYKDDTEIGTMTAESTGASTTLSGTLTGELSIGDELTLKYQSPSYNSQDGTLTGTENSIDKVCDYSTATVTIETLSDGAITTNAAAFTNQQAIVKFTVWTEVTTYVVSEISPTSFTMSDGTSTVTLTDIPEATYTTNGDGVLYVAFPALNDIADITLYATADGKLYEYNKPNIEFDKSNYYRVNVTMKEAVVFSVDETKKVKFSSGNLQYQASTGTWRFAEHQYDYVGNAAGNNTSSGRETQSDWIDLFGWGTSGKTFASGYGTAYQPWTTSTTNNQYGPTDGTSGLTGDYANGDWGVNMGTGWRTLTSDEWTYLFNTRTASTVAGTANARFAKAYLFGTTHGIILFPDSYTHPDGVTAPTGINAAGSTSWNANQYNATDWGKMEAAGAIFLPAAGYRNSTSVNFPGSYALYWSSTPVGSDTESAYSLYFRSSNVNPASPDFNRKLGFSVRLVQVVTP